ncbi:MAG: SCP2 sterol-binding domain-containing protein [Acidobacteria bacterium]|nr:SCP2 sterol-binding domain-containing protein [Acidobacteriota bacterium]MCW5971591.1 SCP2 sterol-binding domain-containing protein [Blastocatellales bacterium]
MSEDTRDLTVEEFTHGMNHLLGEQSGLDATIKIAFEDDRVIFIDGKSTPNAVNNEDQPADVTLRLSLETLNKIYRRELNPVMAAMTGKVRIEGDLRHAMKLEGLLKSFD